MFSLLLHGAYQTQIRNNFVKGKGADLKGAIISSHVVDRLALYQAEALRDALALAD
jgi:hypothetical protein